MADTTCPQPLPAYLGGNIAVLVLTIVLMLPIMGLRLYTRIFLVKAFWWDDAAIIVSTLLYIPFWVFSIDLSRKRLIGLWPCVPKHVQSTLHWEWAAALTVGYLSGMFARISVALLMLRLFSVKAGVKLFLSILTFIMSVFVVYNVVVAYNQSRLKSSHTNVVITTVAGADFAVTDFALATLPIVLIRNLRMKTALKVASAGVLCLGYITTGFAIWRIIEYSSPSPPNPHHQSFAPQYSSLALELEVSCAIIAACLPSFRQFFTRMKLSSRYGSRPLGSREHISLQPRSSKMSSKTPQAGSSERSRSDSTPALSPKPAFPGLTTYSSAAGLRPPDRIRSIDEDDADYLVPKDRIGKQVTVEVA